MLGANIPYRFESKEDAAHLLAATPSLKWEFRHASYGRTGINTMFNHGAEWWLIGTLGICFARVPARCEIAFDGTNIQTKTLK